MRKTSTVSAEVPYPFQLFGYLVSMNTQVVKLYDHKIHCKLKVYEPQYKPRAKISAKKLFISNSMV